MVRICVLGAGIVGLSTARIILETQPTAEVTVIAENFFPDTTSDVAAGIYKPGLLFSGPTKQITRKWLTDAHSYMKNIVNTQPEEAKKAGVVEASGYVFATERSQVVQNPVLDEILEEHRPCTESELYLYSGETRYKYGTKLTTYLIDCSYYLPYLTSKIKALEGKFQKRSIHNFEELSDEFDIICNCTGLGARELCSDVTMIPVRGQILKVKAPWIKKFVFVDYDTYIIPCVDHVVLGGTNQFASWKGNVDDHDAKGIWERCIKVMPSLKNAKVIQECVGFRPYRPIVRVEKETCVLPNGKSLKVVHNYGHGAYGVMSAMGTAMQAASLVREYASASSKL